MNVVHRKKHQILQNRFSVRAYVLFVFVLILGLSHVTSSAYALNCIDLFRGDGRGDEPGRNESDEDGSPLKGRLEKRHPNLFYDFSLDYYRIGSTKKYFSAVWKNQFWDHIRRLETQEPGIVNFGNLYMIDHEKHVSMMKPNQIKSYERGPLTLRHLFRGQEHLLLPLYKFAEDKLKELNRGHGLRQMRFRNSDEARDYSRYGYEGLFTIEEMRLAVGGPDLVKSEQKDDHIHIDPYYTVVALIDGDGLLYYTSKDPRNTNWDITRIEEKINISVKEHLDEYVTNPNNGYVENRQQPDTYIEMNGTGRFGTIKMPHKAARGDKPRIALVIFFKPLDYVNYYSIPSRDMKDSSLAGVWPTGLFSHLDRPQQTVKPVGLFPGSDD